MKLIAKTFQGLEPTLAGELAALGASGIKVLKRAVEYEGDKALLYRSNYWLRTALRVLKPIFNFSARNELQLYKGIQQLDWSKYMDVEDTLAVDAISHSEFFRHSKYAALKTKDAIVDQFRKTTGRRPNIEVRNPSLRVNIRIWKDQITVSLDSSNDSLHRRGYRMETRAAPINEVLAAGMILLTTWRGEKAMMDPMCGSGTILIEAAMIAKNVPPQLFRKGFGFQRWKDFDYGLWSDMVKEAKANIKKPKHPIYGFDISRKAIETASRNIRAARLNSAIQLQQRAFEKLEPTESEGILITNPPYDERLKSGNIVALYRSIGDRLKNHFSGWEAWIISSNQQALKKIGLRPSRKMLLFNGALECKYQGFEMYSGSRKRKAATSEPKKD